MSDPEPAPNNTKSLALMIAGIVITLALVIFWNIRTMQRQKNADIEQLPVIKQLDQPLKGFNHRGEQVSLLEDLRGKVWVMAYFYTECPSGCEGVMGRVKELQTEFADNADKLQFVAVSMNPDHDTPEIMSAWGKEGPRDMGDGNWWFVSGDEKEIRSYMSEHFRLHVNKLPDGHLDHEFKLVLVDQKGAIRYYYDVLGGDNYDAHSKKIRRDIRGLLGDG